MLRMYQSMCRANMIKMEAKSTYVLSRIWGHHGFVESIFKSMAAPSPCIILKMALVNLG